MERVLDGNFDNNDIIDESTLQDFMKTVTQILPMCVASVLTDNDGFVVASHMKHRNLNDELIALQSKTQKRRLINLQGYKKYSKRLSQDVELFLVTKDEQITEQNYRRLIRVIKHYRDLF
ncbi:MAG: hypothetical protein GY870_09865 [archaeon]|nr:hypothetical protein [archaeon]